MRKSKSSGISPTLISLAMRTLIALLLLTLSRFVFLIFNYDSFSNLKITDWLSGGWFDVVTFSLFFLPFIICSILPFSWQRLWFVRFVQKWSFVLPFTLCIALNLLDTAYFGFTQKRSTMDLFTLVSAGNDVKQLVGSFVKDYWLLILLLVVFFLVSIWVYKKTDWKQFKRVSIPGWKQNLVIFAIGLPLAVITGRGGLLIHRPLSPLDATLYTIPQNVSFVLNTPFTLLKSFGKMQLEVPNFYNEKELNQLVQFKHVSQPLDSLPSGTNVIVIMMESFGNEWVGKFNGEKGFTPFLDSILNHSWYFEYGISNGKKSIEGVPNITASMPSLMDNPYISSPYANNKLYSFPAILNNAGYDTYFFHGATNGSMRFDSFTKQIGYKKYIGRKEYNNDKHFDKTWGILDEYFNPWMVKELDKEHKKSRKPFFATLFTLSSHHPYFVPAHWKNKLRVGPNPICRSIHYADESLRILFKEAKTKSWYKNTIFVFTADHTSSTLDPIYSTRSQMYQIPIAFFDPSGKIVPKREKTVFQQADIMPTILDLVNIKATYYSFGHSFFSKEPREALTYLEGSYYYFQEKYMLTFTNKKGGELISLEDKTPEPVDCSKQNKTLKRLMVKRVKALIQRYNSDLIHNRTFVQ
jgi:phosphoglycerol transferase MdoB-like AlkP superfamily enzyme